MQGKEIHDADQLMKWILGKWISKPIYIAAELGIADYLSDTPLPVKEIAWNCGADADSLYRILRALSSLGIFCEAEPGAFIQTPMSALLKSGALRSVSRMSHADWNDRAWSRLLDSVKTGRCAFELAHGMPLFQWLPSHPESAAVLHEANAAKAVGVSRALVEGYGFAGVHSLVDVGGGNGLMLSEILTACPGMKGILADRPRVKPMADERMKQRGLDHRYAFIECDFFQSVPACGDAFLLSNVLHDWEDEGCVAILENCRMAMASNARLLIVEGVIGSGNDPAACLLDLEMMVVTGGRERTLDEYAHLLEASGFSLNRTVPLSGGTVVIEASLAES